MNELMTVAVLIGLGYLAAQSFKRKQFERNVAPLIEEMHVLEDFLRWLPKHTPTLLNKKRQLVFTNEYGVEEHSAYERELRRFVDVVVPSRFKDALSEAALWDTLKREVIWEDRRQRGAANRARREGRELPSLPGIAYDLPLSGTSFEKLVAEALEQNGCQVRHTSVTGDQGVDLLVEVGEVLVAVQCKRSAGPVGNKAVQEVAAGKAHYAVDEAWVVTDAQFTPGARQLAQSNGVRLLHLTDLSSAVGHLLNIQSVPGRG